MSNSFRDAIRQVMTEGAKEKTSDGMTPDAKHFRHDLHKVTDPGVKHMVQKDSETKDYERMFKPVIDKMPTRLSDVEPEQGLNKYVEYNEALKIAEAKKHMKGCTCETCMSKEDKEDEKEAAMSDKKIAEASVMMGRPGMQPKAPVAAPPVGAGPGSVAPAPKPYAGIGAMGGKGTAAAIAAKGTASIATGGAPMPKPAQAPAGAPDKASSGPAVPASTGKPGEDKMARDQAASTQKGAAAPKAQSFKQAFAAARSAAGGAGGKFTWKGKEYQTNVSGEKYKAASTLKPVATGAADAAPKPGAGAGPGRKPSSMSGAAAAAPRPGAGAGPGRAPTPPAPKPQPSRQALQQSYEIEVNGQSYTISEAHAAAIAAYVEKYGINEKSDPAVGEFISKEMKHPEKLTAQGKKQKIKQAIAIYYSKKRHGEKP